LNNAKKQIEQASSSRYRNIDSNFAGGSATVEEKSFKAWTVGLVSAQDFQKAAQEAEQPPEQSSIAEETARVKAAKKERKKRLQEKKKMNSTLSFAHEEDEEQVILDESKEKRSKKDPIINTSSFLPDKERDEMVQSERQRLEREWKDQQEAIKKEKLKITYSYWDGSVFAIR